MNAQAEGVEVAFVDLLEHLSLAESNVLDIDSAIKSPDSLL